MVHIPIPHSPVAAGLGPYPGPDAPALPPGLVPTDGPIASPVVPDASSGPGWEEAGSSERQKAVRAGLHPPCDAR
jgi:hypothetical protein